MIAAKLTAEHIGCTVSVECDGFGAAGTLTGLYTNPGATSLTLHLDADGCHATCMVPWNADVTVTNRPHTTWAQEAA